MAKSISAVVWVVVAIAVSLAWVSSTVQAGTFYASDTGGYFYQVNQANGALTPIGELRDAGGNWIISFGTSLAFDNTGTLWGVDGRSGRVGIINTANAQVTPLPMPTNRPGMISGITFDPVTNDLYAAAENGNMGFYKINKTTGEYVPVGQPTSIAFSGITFASDGLLYGVRYFDGQLYRIDPTDNFSTTALGTAGTLQRIRDVTAYGDGPGVSLFAESDYVGLASITLGSPNTSTIIGGLSRYGQIDGLAYLASPPPYVVPEPSALALSIGIGGMLVAIGCRRRQRPA